MEESVAPVIILTSIVNAVYTHSMNIEIRVASGNLKMPIILKTNSNSQSQCFDNAQNSSTLEGV